MTIRPLTAADRPLLRAATLANMNWNGPRFTLDDLDGNRALAHYYTGFPGARDLGLADQDDVGDGDDVVRSVAWLVFLPAEDPGYGFVDVDVPELSLTTFPGHRGRGIGGALLRALVDEARVRGIAGISLSVEDGNDARHLYERTGFRVVGRSGDADTMLLELR